MGRNDNMFRDLSFKKNIVQKVIFRLFDGNINDSRDLTN